MTSHRKLVLFSLFALLIISSGLLQSWNSALGILNMSILSAIMALGVNLQWGFAGLFNVGIVGFIAIGGLACILIASPPVLEGWSAGGAGMASAMMVLAGAIALAVCMKKMVPKRHQIQLFLLLTLITLFLVSSFYFPARDAIEAINPTQTGFLGGLGMPILFAWIFGGILAGCAAWLVGKISLGLRSDYLAIATLGIAEIIIAVLKNEEWLTRGVKNLTGLPRPVPYEVDLQESPIFISWAQSLGLETLGLETDEFSGIFVKICYFGLFATVLILLLWFAERLLNSPWGRMMRAIRDNETAAKALGKDVTKRHLHLFILGSAIVGLSGAMMTTLDGQFTPASYNPLRYTFLIWVMVIVGGSGNNYGSVLGGFLVWFFWVQSEPLGRATLDLLTLGLAGDNPVREHLLENAAQARLVMMGLVLLLIVRYAPKGLIPEETFRR